MTELLRRTAIRTGRVLAFLLFYGRMLAISTAQVIRRVLFPGPWVGAVIVEVPMRTRSRAEVTALVLCVSMPPGTFVLEVAARPDRMWVHGMPEEDVERLRAELHRLEEVLLRAWRPARAAELGAPAPGAPDPPDSVPEEGPR